MTILDLIEDIKKYKNKVSVDRQVLDAYSIKELKELRASINDCEKQFDNIFKTHSSYLSNAIKIKSQQESEPEKLITKFVATKQYDGVSFTHKDGNNGVGYHLFFRWRDSETLDLTMSFNGKHLFSSNYGIGEDVKHIIDWFIKNPDKVEAFRQSYNTSNTSLKKIAPDLLDMLQNYAMSKMPNRCENAF